MFFKNLALYRLIGKLPPLEQFIDKLRNAAYVTPSSVELESSGLVPPRENGLLVHSVGGQWLVKFKMTKKDLRPSYIQQVTKQRGKELAEQQGFAPGRKQMKELKEQVTDELLPRAFPIDSTFYAWIDPENGWLAVDVGTFGKAEALLKVLIKNVEKFPLATYRTKLSPTIAMTNWLASDEAPAHFTVDQDTELRSTGESKAAVRFVSHTLDVDSTRKHIESGKQCTRLALTWNDRISFVLNENGIIKRIKPLDVLKESNDKTPGNEDERFDSDFTLMAGEFAGFLQSLTLALGGELPAEGN